MATIRTELRRGATVLLQLLLAFGLLLGLVQGFRLLLLPQLQSALALDDAGTSLVRRSGIVLCLLIAYIGYARFGERRKLRELSELRPAPLPIAIGALSGAALIALCMGVLFAIGTYTMTAFYGLQSGLPGIAMFILIAALLEEIAYRGLLFRILENAWGTMPALWLQSLIFAADHIANVGDRATTLELFTTVVSGVMIGAFWTMIFVHTRNLWVVAFNHAAWNFTIILAGITLSGIEDWRGKGLIETVAHGPSWLTGGVFGPEDSIVTIIAVTAVVVALVRLARARQRLRPGFDPDATAIAPLLAPAR